MWERTGAFEAKQTADQEARFFSEKHSKQIKHVEGKYVVIKTFDANGAIQSTEIHSYDRQENKMYSTLVNSKGVLSSLIGVANPDTRTVNWKSTPTQANSRVKKITLACAENSLSAQLTGNIHREGTLLSSFTGELKWIGDLPESDLVPSNS